MLNEFVIVPKKLITGIVDTSTDLFIYVEETDIPEMTYQDLCYIREKIYVLSELTELMR